MTDPKFAQPERRSFLVPVLLAVAALGLAALVAIHFFPATTVNIEHVRTDLLPEVTVYKANSMVLGQNETSQTLFVATTVKLDNQLRAPLYVDGCSLTLTDSTGAQLTAKALEKNELADVELNYHKLKPLVLQPLERDQAIDPGKSAQGTVVFSMSIPQELWEKRDSAVVKVDLYHQQSVYVTIPKTPQP